MPLKWTKDTITCAGKSFAAGSTSPVLIYPSPLNPLAVRRAQLAATRSTPQDFEGTNALLYPRFGDYAVLACRGQKGPALTVEGVETKRAIRRIVAGE